MFLLIINLWYTDLPILQLLFFVLCQLMRVMACNSRLEQKMNSCLWVQKVLTGLVLILMVLNLQCLYLLGTAERPSWTRRSAPHLRPSSPRGGADASSWAAVDHLMGRRSCAPPAQFPLAAVLRSSRADLRDTSVHVELICERLFSAVFSVNVTETILASFMADHENTI